MPRFDGLSPAQWLYGHRQRTDAVASPYAYERITDQQFHSHLDQRGKEVSRVMNRGPKREGKKFDPGDKVMLQDQKTKRWSIEATIVKNHGERSYVVNDGTKEFARNRKFIRGVPPNDSQDQDGQSRELPNHAINQNEHDRASSNEKSNPVAIPHPGRRSKRKTTKFCYSQ